MIPSLYYCGRNTIGDNDLLSPYSFVRDILTKQFCVPTVVIGGTHNFVDLCNIRFDWIRDKEYYWRVICLVV